MSAALGNLSKLNCARLHDISVLFTRLLVYFVIFGCARHSPNKFLKVRLLAMAKFE